MAAAEQSERIDILIGGGGLAGLSLTVALRQALAPGIAITFADWRWICARKHVSAIALGILHCHRGSCSALIDRQGPP